MNQEFLPLFRKTHPERVRRVHRALRLALQGPAERELLVTQARAYVLQLLAQSTSL